MPQVEEQQSTAPAAFLPCICSRNSVVSSKVCLAACCRRPGLENERHSARSPSAVVSVPSACSADLWHRLSKSENEPRNRSQGVPQLLSREFARKGRATLEPGPAADAVSRKG